MVLAICPSCGADIIFKSRFSTTTVCSFCQSFLIKEDKHLLLNGKMSALSEDMSIFQVGTKGRFSNIAFEVIGQLKVNWRDGFWNEWHILEESGLMAWIGEAMGFYSYTREINLMESLAKPHHYQIGDNLILHGTQYVVSDIKPFICEGCIGELPFEIVPGMEGISIDLLSAQSGCSFLEYINNQYRFYAGIDVSFEELNLENMRVQDGW